MFRTLSWALCAGALLLTPALWADDAAAPPESLCRCLGKPAEAGCETLLARLPEDDLARSAANCAAPERGGPTLCQCLTHEAPDAAMARHCDGVLASLEMPAIARARARCNNPLPD
ncbi:MAG: hypothetical protein KDG55_02160 [Rhodocyclaceae bacterium]|nr:hypothetical protein [Rhodocyclaceae bacterium]